MAACLLVGCLAPAAVLAAQAPVVDSFTATPASVRPGETVTLVVEAHDPDCADVCTTGCGTYVRQDLTEWTASGGTFDVIDTGVSGSPYSTTAVWRAPAAEAAYTITVVLRDSGTSFCGSAKQETTVTLDVVVSAVIDLPPTIELLTADPPNPFTGQPSNLRCQAVDPEGLAVTFAWSATFGALTPTVPGEAVFVAEQPGAATVTCTATDPGGTSASRSIAVSASDAMTLATIRSQLATPQRVAVDSMGDVFVVDRGAAGIAVLSLFTGAHLYRLPIPDATSVAVDWNDNLVIGRGDSAVVADRGGTTLFALGAPGGFRDVADVAVDAVSRRYAVLDGSTARVTVFDRFGTLVTAFGSIGDGPGQLRNPRGLAASPAGEWVVADGVHGLIKAFDASGTLIRSFGGIGGGAGEFVQLDDVAVGADGVVFASDAFQSRVQSFNSDGSVREIVGTWGDGPGGLRTPTGLTLADGFRRLVVASLNTPGLQVFRLAGPEPTAPAPGVTLSTDTVFFGSQMVGTVSPGRTVVLSNPGTAPLGLGAIVTTGAYEQSNGCGPYLDPGATCAVLVTFEPTAAGASVGELRIATSAAAGTVTVSLVGEGFVPAALALSPGEIGFPDQDVLTVSEPRAVMLTNTGSVPLSIAGISAVGEFEQVNGCGVTLGPGSSCSVLVSFAPVTIADHVLGAVQIDSTALGSPHQVLLDGRGVGLALSAAPSSIDFGDVEIGSESAPRTVTVRNIGSNPVSVHSAILTGSDATEFRVVGDGCSSVALFRDQTCDVTLVYAATTGGAASASLSIASDALGSPDTVELLGGAAQGDGVAIPTLSEWGLIGLMLLLAGAGMLALKRGGGA